MSGFLQATWNHQNVVEKKIKRRLHNMFCLARLNLYLRDILSFILSGPLEFALDLHLRSAICVFYPNGHWYCYDYLCRLLWQFLNENIFNSFCFSFWCYVTFFVWYSLLQYTHLYGIFIYANIKIIDFLFWYSLTLK